MRFAGSRAEISPQPMASARSGGNYSAAAGVVDVGNTFTSMRAKAPRYDQLSAAAMQNQSQEKQAAMNAEATVTASGMQAYGAGKQSQMQAQAAIESAKIQADAQKQSSMMGAIGSIGGALIGLSDESTKTAIDPIDSAL